MACPGPDKCGGHYPVSPGFYLHPPKVTPLVWPKSKINVSGSERINRARERWNKEM